MKRSCKLLIALLLGSVAIAATSPQNDLIAKLTSAEIEHGRQMFVAHCAVCHGIEGTGGRGPSLNQPSLRRVTDDRALFNLIQTGVEGSEMPGAWWLSEREIWQVAGYVRSLGRTKPVNLPGDAGNGKRLYLYSCSLLAIDASSGKLKWHFQFTPHDVHDWDATEIPVLLDAGVGGRTRKLVAMANRNAFFYLLDRETGEFLQGTTYAKQTWASGLDAKGRPITLPNTEPTVEGNLVYPSLQGATNWFSPSYNPRTKLFYVAVREMGAHYYKGEAEYKPGTFFAGGGERAIAGDKAWGAIRALEVETGKMKWEFRLQSPPWSGVLATAGGVVFGGSDEGNFYALDAANGKPLWEFQTGGPMASNPVGFLIDGKQHVAMASGHALFVFGLPKALAPSRGRVR